MSLFKSFCGYTGAFLRNNVQSTIPGFPELKKEVCHLLVGLYYVNIKGRHAVQIGLICTSYCATCILAMPVNDVIFGHR